MRYLVFILMMLCFSGCQTVVQESQSPVKSATTFRSFDLKTNYKFVMRVGFVIKMNRTYTLSAGNYRCIGEDSTGAYFVNEDATLYYHETGMPLRQSYPGGIFVPFERSKACRPFSFEDGGGAYVPIMMPGGGMITTHVGGGAAGRPILIDCDMPADFREAIVLL